LSYGNKAVRRVRDEVAAHCLLKPSLPRLAAEERQTGSNSKIARGVLPAFANFATDRPESIASCDAGIDGAA